MPIDGLPGGDFAGCVREMTGKVDDPRGFCAWKIHDLSGKWPAEEGTREQVKLTGIKPREGGPYPGSLWDVTLIGPDPTNGTPSLLVDGDVYIASKNGLLYRVDALSGAVRDFEGAKVYDNHLTDEQFAERHGMRSFKNELVGTITDVKYNGDALALAGVLRVGDRQYAQKLKDFHDLGTLEDAVGLSIDTFPEFGKVRHEGQSRDTVEGFKKVNSVDIVTEPAAGGGFNRLIAAQQQQEVVRAMEITQEQVKDWVADAVAEALAATQHATEQEEPETPEEGAEEVIQAVMDEVEEAIMDVDTPAEAAQVVAEIAADAAEEVIEETMMEGEEHQAEGEELNKLQEQVRALECRVMLGQALDAAKLDPANRRIVEAAFSGQVFSKEQLMAVIKRAKEAQAANDPSGRVVGSGGRRDVRITGMMDAADRAQIDFMRRVWGGTKLWRQLEHSQDHELVAPHVTEAYKSWVRAGKPEHRAPKLDDWLASITTGDVWRNPRKIESINVSYIVQDAVNVMLALDYSARNEWWEPLVTVEEVDTIDDANLVRTYGIADLPIVNKGAAYTELEWNDDEETGTYKKRGGYVGVTREDFLLDKVGAIRNIPRNLNNSWYNTQGSLVAAVFTINSDTGPTLSDTGKLFNATATTSAGGHANLLTAALSYTSFDASYTAMLAQTDKKLGAGNKLLIQTKYLLVPLQLRALGLQIRNTELKPNSANNDINPYFQEFDVITVPQWTDTNNWATAANPDEWPHIHMIYPRGARTPQVYTADSETSGAVFTNDEIRYKTRLEVYQKSATDVCAPVADFRPLHKNNVA